MTPDVVGVRQNLDMLVEKGVANPSARSDASAPWGATFQTGIATGRSAMGTRNDGTLVYVQGPRLSPAGLAQLLITAGVDNGMELDINPMWPLFTFVTRSWSGARIDKLSPTMRKGADTFLTPSIRDFIAVTTRS